MITKQLILMISIVPLIMPALAQPTHVDMWQGEITVQDYKPLGEYRIENEMLLEQVVLEQVVLEQVVDTTPSTLPRRFVRDTSILSHYYEDQLGSFAGFIAGNCTVYVASQRPDIVLYEDGRRRISGNAGTWLAKAKQTGLSTGTEPHVGAIAVYAPGRGATGLGHVGIVQEVRNDGTIVLRDMNYAGKHIVTVRIVSASLAQGYIY